MGRSLLVPLLALATLISYFILFQEQLKRSSTATYADYVNPRRPAPQDDVMRFEIAGLRQLQKGELSRGTAFSIDGRSKWLTARHVVVPCLGENFRGQIGSAAILDVQLSGQNDLALVTTEPVRSESIGSIRLDAGNAGQPGFITGYAGADLVQISVHWIGPGSARQGYPPYRQQTVSVWSEADRAPAGLYSLGGMSGAALIASDGSVLGVLSAVLSRRGRVLIARIDDFAAQSARPPKAHPAPAYDVIATQQSAQLAAARGSVAKLRCSGG